MNLEETFRWQSFFQHGTEPLFLVNGRRRLLFVNRAWENLTGLSLAEVRGKPCKRLANPDPDEPWQGILACLVPPPEVFEGRPALLRRRTPRGTTRGGWWEIAYFPLLGTDRLLGILGKITLLASPGTSVDQPLPEKIANLRQRFVQQFDLNLLTSEHPVMARIQEQARLAAGTRVPVLIVGPAGTGKHWLARAIHQGGPNRDQPFLRLDCARLPPHLLARMLFAQPGRFAPGTIYLREPGAMPRELQERLNQWLVETPESSEATGDGRRLPRILAGSKEEDKATGRMLPGLFSRLSILTITLPPLRERLADLDWLLPGFLSRCAAVLQQPTPTLTSEVQQILRSHAWPGNLRELYQVLLTACSRSHGKSKPDEGPQDQSIMAPLQPEDLPFYLHAGQPPHERSWPLDVLLEQVEKRLILLALKQTQNNKTRAAELLGIWRPRLMRRLESLGLAKEGE